jgi:hypothetical protein
MPAEDDEAVFAIARIVSRRRSWLPAAVGALVVAAFVGSGLLFRDPPQAQPTDAARGPAAPTSGAVAERPASRASSLPRDAAAGIRLMQIDARPDGQHLWVHGDVFSMAAFRVVVSLEEGAGVTATRTVHLPGGSTAFLTEANPRFLVEFNLGGDATGPVFVRADAYDTDGHVVVTLRQPVVAGTTPGPTSATPG